MNELTRRRFLELAGIGAAGTLAFPALSRVAQAGSDIPRRFVFVLTGNGFDASQVMAGEVREWIASTRGRSVDDAKWWSGRYGRSHVEPHALATTFSSAPALEVIERHGLAEQTAVVLGLSSRVTGGGHSTYHGVLSSTRTLQDQPGGRTIDALVAALPSVRGAGETRAPFEAVRVGVHGDPRRTITYESSAMARHQPLPIMQDPVAAHDLLLGPFLGSEETLDSRDRLLAFARRDAERRHTEVSAAAARAQIGDYREAIDEMIAGQERLHAIRAEITRAGTPLPERPEPELAPLDAMRAQCRLAAAALRIGLTNVAVVGMGAGGGFNTFYYGLDAPTTSMHRHSLSHRFDADPAIRLALREVWRQEIEAVADLARELADTPDPIAGSGTMLDHTVIVYVTDNGAEHHSNAGEFPLLLLGGRAMGLRTEGRTIVYPDVDNGGPAHRQLSNLWNTLGGPCAGTTLEDFGDDVGRIAHGPLPELLG